MPISDAPIQLPDKLLREGEVAALLGVSTSKLQKARVYGGGPRFLKLGTKKGSAVRYRAEDIYCWQKAVIR